MSTRATKLILSALLAGSVAMFVTACAPASGPGATPTSSDEPVDIATEIVGMWGSDATGEPHLEFADDGTVTGSDGCNGISTTYTVDGERAEIEKFASTLKACPGVDDWLRGIRSVEIDGDTLVAMNSSGDTIGQLDRR